MAAAASTATGVTISVTSAPVQRPGTARLLFTGTGTSEGVPRVSCLTLAPGHQPTGGCDTCTDAVKPGSKNRRGNTGAVISLLNATTPELSRHCVIDVGKYFWQSAIRLFPEFGVNDMDAIVLTHEHADAIHGLDDVRDWTRLRAASKKPPVTVYLDDFTKESVKVRFPYLMNASAAASIVADLRYERIDHKQPFAVPQMEVTTPVFAALEKAADAKADAKSDAKSTAATPAAAPAATAPAAAPSDNALVLTPLPVEHGKNYTALGFLIGRHTAYISDCSFIYPSTVDKLRALKPFNLLVLDCLRPHEAHPTHFSMTETLNFLKSLAPNPPKRCVLVGMGHDFEHDETNKELADKLKADPALAGGCVDVQLAYDGQCIELQL